MMFGFYSLLKKCRKAERQRRHIAGFTTLELLIAVAIAAILAALAAPSFTTMIANQRAKNVASELFASLLRARSEALARNTSVTLSPKTGNWQNGWRIVDPTNTDKFLDDQNMTSGATITGPVSVVYTGTGRIQGSSVPMFVIKSMAGSTPTYQCVSVELSGRPYMQAASSC
ncbi:MAG: GspH/FimT family protein [Burkholderiales bacterium]|nr:GspH/FimT family protein [Burkholderiales bacterium]